MGFMSDPITGTTGSVEPNWDKNQTADGSVVWKRTPPEESRIQKAAHAIYKKFYKNFEDGFFGYFFYATWRWGLAEGIKRYWTYHLHPRNIIERWARRYRVWKRIDRRDKQGYSRSVYAVDRDGDLYLVECPQCSRIDIFFNWDYENKKAYTDTVPPKAFQCSMCEIGFTVYLEDGLRRLRDHRKGVPPLPSIVVWDDTGTCHLGIAKDAPWWWRRREIYRDYDPDTGKDGHGHYKYEIFPVKSSNMNEACGSCVPETPQGSAQ